MNSTQVWFWRGLLSLLILLLATRNLPTVTSSPEEGKLIDGGEAPLLLELNAPDRTGALQTVQAQDAPYRYYLYSIGAQAAGGEFNYPSGVAVAPDGSTYVVDSRNNRIQHFGATGALINAWGSAGAGEGQFISPSGVAVAPDGTVYVTDAYSHRVQRFSATGSYLDQWEGHGADAGQSTTPSGIAVALDGTIYVVDSSNHRIQYFNASGLLG